MLNKYMAILMGVSCVSVATLPITAQDAPAKKVEVKASDLTLSVPETWKQQQPSNNLRLAQFIVPAPKEGIEPAELVISGPFGGTASQNIQRWVGQFAPEGRQAKMTQGESKQGKYILIDMTGTYKKSVGPPFRRQTKAVEGYRVINVMLSVTAGKGGNYFLKLAGPSETLEAVSKELRAIFGGDASKESAYEL